LISLSPCVDFLVVEKRHPDEDTSFLELTGLLIDLPLTRSLKRYDVQSSNFIILIWAHLEFNKVWGISEAGEILFFSGTSAEKKLNSISKDKIRPSDFFGETKKSRTSSVSICDRTRNIVVSTDWSGSVPVFYGKRGERRVVASNETMAKRALGISSADVSIEGVCDLIRLGYFPGENTLYEGLKRVHPDSNFTWQFGADPRQNADDTLTVRRTLRQAGTADLVEEMFSHYERIFGEAFNGLEEISVPLSGGLDSRIIAAFAVRHGVHVNSYTYFNGFNNAFFAERVSRSLGTSHTHIKNALTEENMTEIWLRYFGTYLHVHGVYQYPLIEALQRLRRTTFVGFLGDPLAGDRLKNFDGDLRADGVLQSICSLTPDNEIEKALSPGYTETSSGDSVKALIDRTQSVSGEKHVRFNIFDIWTRQANFIFYHPQLLNLYAPVQTPFVDLEYASFCISLSRDKLFDRALLKQLVIDKMPEISKIGGTFTHDAKPLVQTKMWLLKERLGRRLRKVYPDNTGKYGVSWQTFAVKHDWRHLFFPFGEDLVSWPDFLDHDYFLLMHDRARKGDPFAYRMMVRAQPILWAFSRQADSI